MTSERKRATNQRNAKRSTGPRSAAGKANSRNNALRHGLARPPPRLPGQTEEIEQLALALAGSEPTPEMLQYARIAAEAELDVMRVQAARADFISRKAVDPATFMPQKLVPERTIEELRKLLALAPPEIFAGVKTHPAESLQMAIQLNEYRLARPLPKVEDRPAVAFGRHYPELSRFNRYERRALSRRKRALRALDQLHIEGGGMS